MIDMPRATVAHTRQSPVHMAEIVRRGLMLADAAVVTDIEAGASEVIIDGVLRWYDVRPMLDEREHSMQIIDMATEALTYAEQRGLIERHLVDKHMVRIARGR